MMKFYIGTGGVPVGSPERSTIGGVKYIAELGLNAMEIEFVRGVKMSVGMAKEVGEVASKLNVKLSVHAPYYVNLCSPDKSKVEASKKRILESVERAYYMNASPVVFHPGYYGKLSKEECFELVKQACLEMVDEIKSNGWEKVILGLETTGKIAQFGTLDENLRIMKEVKGATVVVDWAHIYARNSGRINFKEILDILERFKIRHLHTHFSGMEFSPVGVTGKGNERRHLNLTEGAKPDYKPLVDELPNRKFESITFISESPNLEGDALWLKARLEKAFKIYQ